VRFGRQFELARLNRGSRRPVASVTVGGWPALGLGIRPRGSSEHPTQLATLGIMSGGFAISRSKSICAGRRSPHQIPHHQPGLHRRRWLRPTFSPLGRSRGDAGIALAGCVSDSGGDGACRSCWFGCYFGSIMTKAHVGPIVFIDFGRCRLSWTSCNAFERSALGRVFDFSSRAFGSAWRVLSAWCWGYWRRDGRAVRAAEASWGLPGLVDGEWSGDQTGAGGH